MGTINRETPGVSIGEVEEAEAGYKSSLEGYKEVNGKTGRDARDRRDMHKKPRKRVRKKEDKVSGERARTPNINIKQNNNKRRLT